MVMVINEPCCMSTGRPARNCGCRQHRKRTKGLVANIPEDLDYNALAELLEIESDPGENPIGFVQELRSAVGEVQDRLNLQSQPAPAFDDSVGEANGSELDELVELESDPHTGWDRPETPAQGTNPSTSRHIGKRITDNYAWDDREVLDLDAMPHRRPINNRSERDKNLDGEVAMTIAERWGRQDGQVFYPEHDYELEVMDLESNR